MRLRPLVAVVCGIALLPAAAAAQGPVVAQNADTTVTLRAERSSFLGVELLSVTLRSPNADSEPDDEPQSGSVPVWADQAVIAFRASDDPQPDGTRRVFFGGAVPAAATAVEVTVGRAQPLRIATSESAAFTGRYGGLLRFFVAEQRVPAAVAEAIEEDNDDEVDDIRLFDAAGEVIGIPALRLPRRSVRVADRRLPGGGRLLVTAHLITRLAPVPGQPARTHEVLCLVMPGDGTTDGDSSDCQPPGATAEQPRLHGFRGCGSQPTTIAGILPAAAQTVVAVLGSGRQPRYAAQAAPFGRPGRVVAAALPRGEALRRILVLDAGGRVLRTLDARAAPPDRRCINIDNELSIDDDFEAPEGIPEGTQTAAAIPGGPRIVVRDQGDEICLGIDDLALDNSNCFLPPFSYRTNGLGQLRGPGGAIVLAGVFNARVASVELTLDDKRKLRVPAAAGTEYSGRWRETTRFFLTALPAGRSATEALLLDGEGRALGTASIEASDAETTTTGRTLIRAGRARLRADRLETFVCLAPLFGSRYALSDECSLLLGDDNSDLFVAASCAPRTTLIGGFARPGVKRVEIRLASGRVLRPRLVRVPGLRGRAFLQPTGAAVTRVRFVGHRRDREDDDTIETPVVAAKKQCGYEFEDLLI